MASTELSLLLLLLVVLSSVPLIAFSSEPLNPEVEALIAIRQGLVDPHGVLSNWDEDSVDPCSWAMITCSAHNLVIGLGVPSQGLSGTLSGRIANLTNLEQVLLQNNNISGRLPPELGALPRLQTLDLSNNHFSGRVPDTLGHLSTLRYLRLNNNSLSGAFPSSLAKIPRLSFLDLSYNNLTGPVPRFPTRTFNVVGNPMICGSGHAGAGECATVLAPVTVPFPLDSTPTSGSSAGVAAAGRSKGGAARLPIGVGTSLGASSLVLFAVSCFLWRRRRRQHCRLTGSSVLGILEMGRDVEDGGGCGEVVARLGNVRQFGLRELQSATDGFSAKNILGKGGFGDVYRGKLSDGTVVAVKRLKDPSASGEAQFRTEVEMISLAVHRHLLRLVGFCAAPSGERLLVYPFMPNGSVASRLRGTYESHTGCVRTYVRDVAAGPRARTYVGWCTPESWEGIGRRPRVSCCQAVVARPALYLPSATPAPRTTPLPLTFCPLHPCHATTLACCVSPRRRRRRRRSPPPGWVRLNPYKNHVQLRSYVVPKKPW
ncbi:hypothetical protein GUJ93_ZPchr0010g7325 [Zizania palustris]|uniref:Protein kinase domain-containing protein n=1 Tax=Zizania palustris TaxID=103762 RepID=A0A8J6BGA8_ZIZPA|nr:hypothetical protein GUJ93_ZPchr0010g7325 [Zizania palustris]